MSQVQNGRDHSSPRVDPDDLDFESEGVQRPTLSIGALSRASGVPASTLRTWERRYGFPAPDRSDTGRREYPASLTLRIRLVAAALEAGHPPRHVLNMDEEGLRTLLGAMVGRPEKEGVPTGTRSRNLDAVESWLDATVRLDADALEAGFNEALHRLGLERFIRERASPFLNALGEAWERGRVQPYQEHLASLALGDFIAASRRPLAREAVGPVVVCATLPGELHHLGLQMAAALMALAGVRVLYVGPDTPIGDIDACARQSQAVAVAISVSRYADTRRLALQLDELCALLPERVEVVVGGRSGLSGQAPFRRMPNLDDVLPWAEGVVSEWRAR
jgi:methanogenic corrinoid protein MtbC1